MATVLDIVRGISQAAANAYDGSHDERYNSDGEARKVGLKREEGDPILDWRVMVTLKTRNSSARIEVILVRGEIELLGPNMVFVEPPPKALPISDPLPCWRSISAIKVIDISM